MNNINPLRPQGSQFEQAASQARNRFKLAVYVSLAVCAVSLTVLLALGCKKEEPIAPPTKPNDFGTLPPAPTDTNPPAGLPPLPPGDTAVPGTPSTAQPLPPGPAGGSVQPLPPSAEPPVPPVTPPAAPPAATKEYKVQKGESYYTIGKKLGVNYRAIEKANPTIPATKLKEGMSIVIPEAVPSTPSLGTETHGLAPGATGAAGTVTHKVVAGDNLGKLSKKYGVSVKEIQKANNLTTTRIKVGDSLKIPSKATPAEPAPTPTPVPLPTPEPTPGTVPPSLPPAGTPPATTPGSTGPRPA